MANLVPTIDEIDDAEKLEAYMRTRPVKEAQVIAFRASVRVMPLVQSILSQETISLTLKKQFSLDLFRAVITTRLVLGFNKPAPAEQLIDVAATLRGEANALSRIDPKVDYKIGWVVADAAVALERVAEARQFASRAIATAITCFDNPEHILLSPNVSSPSLDTNSTPWEQVREDLRSYLRSNVNVVELPLWSALLVPENTSFEELRFNDLLSGFGAHWLAIADFYNRHRDGGVHVNTPIDFHDRIYRELLKNQEEFWTRDPDEVMRDIALWFSPEEIGQDQAATPAPPEPGPEPEPGPGAQYDIVDGKLGIVASIPPADEVAAQARLFERLQRDVERLVNATHRIDNSHPNLAYSIREYGVLLDTPLAALDVTGVWSVGSSLAGFAQSFREQNRNRTLAEPLEPEVDGLLQSVIRQHGAFIMGFEEGRDLVDRADRFTLDTETIRGLEESGNQLLAELAFNADLVHVDARALHRSVNDYILEFGWASRPVRYAAYLLVRNAVIRTIKLTVSIGAFGGGVTFLSTISGDPNLEFIRASIPFLQVHAQDLLAFFSHSPEMHAYVQWALYIIR